MYSPDAISDAIKLFGMLNSSESNREVAKQIILHGDTSITDVMCALMDDDTIHIPFLHYNEYTARYYDKYHVKTYMEIRAELCGTQLDFDITVHDLIGACVVMIDIDVDDEPMWAGCLLDCYSDSAIVIDILVDHDLSAEYYSTWEALMHDCNNILMKTIRTIIKESVF
jgi:hypothetical protein